MTLAVSLGLIQDRIDTIAPSSTASELAYLASALEKVGGSIVIADVQQAVTESVAQIDGAIATIPVAIATIHDSVAGEVTAAMNNIPMVGGVYTQTALNYALMAQQF